MKHRFILVFCMTAFAITCARGQQQINTDKIIQDRLDYLKANLSLTAAESENFWPEYTKYLRSEIALHHTYKTRLADKGIKLNSPGNNKEVYDKLNDTQLLYLQEQRFQLKKDLVTLDIDYYNIYKKLLSPRHLIEFYRIDEGYKRALIRKMKTQSTTK